MKMVCSIEFSGWAMMLPPIKSQIVSSASAELLGGFISEAWHTGQDR